jgi:ligand-binding sensor domain-containing protein/signal transduction histidine kinase
MLAWLFALLAAASQVQAAPPGETRYIVRAWGTAEGLPQNSVTSIVQTRDGYLWVGTFGGLARFDGQAFTVFDPDSTPGLASARIVVLHEDRNGVLWIGTEAGLTKYDAGRFTSYTTREGLPHLNILALLHDSRGRLWIGTGDGLVTFDGRTFERVPVDPLAPVILALSETPDGNVWVSTRDGIARFHHGDPLVVVSRQSATNLLVDTTGRLWLGGATLMRWEGGRFVDVQLTPPGRRIGAIAGIVEDRGTLWVGTMDGSVYRWHDGGPAETVAKSTTGLVRALRRDRNGNIWFGTDVGGLTRLKPRQVFSYPYVAAKGQSIGPIVGDGANGLWIGGTCGHLLHFRAGVFDRPVLEGCIWALLRDPDGTLWTGSGETGLQRLAGGRVTSYTRAEGIDYNIITALARDRDGTLWVGHEAGLSRFEDGRFTNVGRDDGLRHRVLCIQQDRAGALWIGGADGVYRVAGGRVTNHYTRAEGLSHNHVRAIHEDADGVLWIGTYGGGLNRFKNGRFTSYGLKDGLPDTAVSRIIEDERGNLWMSGNRGVFRVARSQLNDFAEGRIPYLTSVTYGTADGMIIEETNGGFPAGWRTPDGRLWFPTIKGLVGIEPTVTPATMPPVVIEHTIADGRRVDRSALAALGPGNLDAEFHYTAIDLGAAEKTRFRYRLDGYDREWNEAGTRRVAYYTGVRPGSYHFEVMATDSDGRWTTTPARIGLVIAPFWWQRRPVQTAGLALLLAATALGVRHVSLRRARARVAELERERALDTERSRIARDLHDDLGSRLSHIAIMAGASGDGDRDVRIAREARDAVRTMDELVWAVNARNDTLENFAYYVAQFAEEHVIAAGVRCRLQLPPELPARALAADVRRHLYLAVKEAINNALKHARASEIRLTLRVDADTLVVEVADDGRGLPADRDPTGNGLKNFRERMEAAGGTVEVESAPGQGTRLRFRAPF